MKSASLLVCFAVVLEGRGDACVAPTSETSETRKPVVPGKACRETGCL